MEVIMRRFALTVLGPIALLFALTLIPQWLWLPALLAAFPVLVRLWVAQEVDPGIQQLENWANSAAVDRDE